ncbi:MAG: glutathione S-transferase family protein [Parvularcula sp.]
MPGTLDFYTNPMSRGQIARWALEEVGADYTEHLLEYGTTMKGADYLSINPMGKVPAIVHKGRVVTEAAAICAYLVDAFPAAGLLPSDQERADYFRWFFFAAGPVEAAITANRMGWAPEGPQEQGTVGWGSYELTISAMENALDGKPFVCGERFTGADIYFGAQVDWGLQFGSIPDRPVFQAYAERLRQRDAYKKAKARDGELIAAAKK